MVNQAFSFTASVISATMEAFEKKVFKKVLLQLISHKLVLTREKKKTNIAELSATNKTRVTSWITQKKKKGKPSNKEKGTLIEEKGQ